MSNAYPGPPDGAPPHPGPPAQQYPGYAAPPPQGARVVPATPGAPGPGGAYPAQPAQGTRQVYPQAYRPGGFAPSPADWGSMNAAVAPPPNTTGPIEQVWAPGQRGNNRYLFTVIASIAGAVALVVALVFIMLQTGVGPTVVSFFVALIPLTIVLLGVIWLDRWEPEPRSMLLVALLWGAGVSVLSALVVNTALINWIYAQTLDAEGANTLGAVIVAPVVEETVKGLGVLLIFLMRRHHFDGPVDGVVYAATVAAGFAFTENILYFSREPDFLPVVFVMRGIMSPFAHALFTSCIGIAIGMAARSKRSTTVFIAFPVGLVGAMGLHALWNGSASIGNNFFAIYLLIQVPMFLATVALMFWLRRQEAEVIRARLGEYAQAGWYAPHEVQMLSSLRQRGQARSWAAGYGERAKAAMKSFQRDSTSLAYLRQRVLTGRAELRASQSEHELLNQVQRDRHVFSSSARGFAG